MLQFCSVNLPNSPSPTPFLSKKLASIGFNHSPAAVRLNSPKGYYKEQIFRTNAKCIHSSNKWENSNRPSERPIQSLNVTEKVHCLASEFRSLPEPIDRVKRLLHYATLLPPFDESARVQENRVTGCTTMVWLDAKMDNNRLMRFKVDSDSEITKGFSSCLIWLFDGAIPEEILSVKNDDLLEMNVGFPSRSNSRVNTWNNILFTMQKRTQNLIEEKNRELPLNDFPPLFIRPDDPMNANGSCKEAQVIFPQNQTCNRC
ncbi:hypothetical protein M9H77_10221 [Catharanthus roseus]|uniref:Uncharacterized protein n=1 Tax=Catharanthus roseus TaxID=4058 RepID=A0ACC0C3A0_CATRO|nr:hypothetical protein M9H77_10221 [Catharanthus roseus]